MEILIKGENKLQGLVQILGCAHGDNHLVCSIGFKLFCSLFDYEFNKGIKTILKKILKSIFVLAADFFIEVFNKISLEEFKCLNLKEHIIEKPSKNCKQYALKIMEIYLEANPNALNNVFT